jgi:excisionase family DNA binding protein
VVCLLELRDVGLNGERKDSFALLGEALFEAIRQAVRQEIEAFFSRNGRAAADDKDGSKEYFSIKEAAEFARMAPSTIRLYIRKRHLRAQQVGRRVIIKRTDLEKFLETNPIEVLPDAKL